MPLMTARGSALQSSTTSTVAGTTLGVEVIAPITALPCQWISPPIDQDVTISGTITFNIWAAESSMNANVALNCIIERIGSDGAVISTIVKTARVTEVAVTTRAVNNFTASPTSTNMLKGDRIRIRIFGDDAGTMASGFSFTCGWNGDTAAADGDTYVTFTETFGFLTTDPTTTTIYPTTTASDIDPGGAGTDTNEAWTARGSGVTQARTNLVAGWTAPIQCTTSAGGNFIEWYTKQLQAFTLAAPVLVNVRLISSTGSPHSAARLELAICDSAGSVLTTWAATSHPTQAGLSETVFNMYLAGDDTAVSDSNRLRLRFFLDDDASTAMLGTGGHVTDVKYAGTSGGASGDTYLIFGQTLTEFVSSKAPLFARRFPRVLLNR